MKFQLGMEDIFDTAFLDELPSTPRLRCTAFQSSPDSTSERDVRHLLSSNAQRSPLMTAPSRRITRRRSSSEFDDITERGIMGLCVMPVTLGERLGDAGDGHSAESPVGRRRRKRVVRRISLQSTPDASPDRSVVAEEVSALPVTPPAQPQRCRRSDSHNGAWTGQDGSDHRGSVALGEESAVIADLTNTPSVGVEHLQSIAPGYSTAQTVRVAESQLSRSTSVRLGISMSGRAALNMRGRALLSDDKESHNVHTGRPATAQATDTCVGWSVLFYLCKYLLNFCIGVATLILKCDHECVD
uniref:CARMIL_C domain-containing protein n=1 Tax=Ascaris lumbricoides TaxID=6252 RepID=A0A0M3I261_ASCLU